MVGLAGLGRALPPPALRRPAAAGRARPGARRPSPTVVLLDEPFASLDATSRASVREDVRGVLKAAGATAILVTHDQDEALSLADLVAVLRGGRIAQSATPTISTARRSTRTWPASSATPTFWAGCSVRARSGPPSAPWRVASGTAICPPDRRSPCWSGPSRSR